MAKLTKLFKRPVRFWVDWFRNTMKLRNIDVEIREAVKSGKPTAMLVGFSDWKLWMTEFLPEYNVIFLGHTANPGAALIDRIKDFPSPHVFAWSYKFPGELTTYCKENNIQLTYVEDGFLRSVGLGANKTRPMSLVFDDRAMHFDRNRISDLDVILNQTDFDAQPELVERARTFINQIKGSGVSKYVSLGKGGSVAEDLQLDTSRRTLLVLGQVEDDLSIAFGMRKFMSGNELVARVALENPDANILYRPHPESLAFSKPHYSKPSDVEQICHVIGPEYSLAETLMAADEAHTMTSLAGLEAAMAGLKVHTYGGPFYSGWGFTVDHDGPSKKKRTRPLTLEEVVAGAYLLYPRYFHPVTGKRVDAEEILNIIQVLLAHMHRIADNREARRANAAPEELMRPEVVLKGEFPVKKGAASKAR
jgi:capsular polysaccharide export protein